MAKNKVSQPGDEANLARRIARERAAAGLSYEALAKLMSDAGCKIHGSAIYKIEKGKPARTVSVNELVALSTVLGRSVENLLTPLEVLDDHRARELVAALEAADVDLLNDVVRLVQVYRDWLALSGSEQELFEYVAGHMDQELDRIWNGPGIVQELRSVGLSREATKQIWELVRAFHTDLVNATSGSFGQTADRDESEAGHGQH